MDDKYLWDRTGEPDAEVQQLEELLGTLRLKPRPLEIPATVNIRRRRMIIPLAIAAAIALLVIGAGLWVRFANSKPGTLEQANGGRQSTAAPHETSSTTRDSVAVAPQERTRHLPRQRKVNQTFVALKPSRPAQTPAPSFTAQELAQKEQVLIALRLVSAKLNLAQRKTQGLPQANAIRNQHKIG